MVNGNADAIKTQWQSALSTVLKGYKKVASSRLGAVALFVFANDRLIPAISNVQRSWISTGTAYFPNKGAAAVRFSIGDSTIAFVNAHFAAGTQLDVLPTSN